MKNLAERGTHVRTDAPAEKSPGSGDLPAGGPTAIDVYLVRTRRRSVLFVTRRALAAYAASEKDRFLKFVRRMMRSRNRAVRFVGRVTRAGHRYYQRLEDRIDPQERMIKALNYPGTLNVWHAPGVAAREVFNQRLQRQVYKHTSWVVIDGGLTVVAILLAPILVPIPGPNVSFFYPFLRLLSHRQALRGARRARSDDSVRFREMPELDGVAERVSNGGGSPEAIEGLHDFLRRVR